MLVCALESYDVFACPLQVRKRQGCPHLARDRGESAAAHLVAEWVWRGVGPRLETASARLECQGAASAFPVRDWPHSCVVRSRGCERAFCVCVFVVF